MDTSVKGAENHFIRTFPKSIALKPPSADFDPAPRQMAPSKHNNINAATSSSSIFIPRAPVRSASHASYAPSSPYPPTPISTSGSGWEAGGAARSPIITTPTSSYFQAPVPKSTQSALSTVHAGSPPSWQPAASAVSPPHSITSLSSTIGSTSTLAPTRAFRPPNALPISRAEYDAMPEMERYNVARYLHSSQNNPSGLKATNLWRPTWAEDDEVRLWDVYLTDGVLRESVRTLVESKLSRDPRRR